jgi:NADH-quinone oxidoreductase subunit M
MPLIFLLLIPALAILLIFLRASARQTALMAALFNFSYSIVLLLQFKKDALGFQFVLDIPWAQIPLLPTIHFHLGLDGFSLPLILLATTVTLAAIAISPADSKRPREFFVYLLLISLGSIGAFLSLDLFFFFIFHEFALIPTFLLIGIWGSQNRLFAGMQITLYLTVGSLVLLAGILSLVLALPAESRTFNLTEIVAWVKAHPLETSMQHFSFLLLALGFGILVSLFPFHTWAPAGYAAAPPAAAMLHAGVLKKFGLYGLMRVAIPLLPEGLMHWAPWLQFLLLGNILYIGFVTLAQKELPALLGFSSVMHMGYLFLGLIAWNTVGLTGVVLLMVAHGLSAALLFGLAGEIQYRCGETRFEKLGGLAQRAPFLCFAFVVASLASIGMPGLANFAGELLIFLGAWTEFKIATILALAGVVISAVYQLRAISSVFYGPLPQHLENFTDLKGFRERAPYVLLLGLILVLGVAPNIIVEIASQGLLGAALAAN